MEAFVELGLSGADKLIDKHFHKMPDKAFRPDTYNPKNIHMPGRKKHKSSQDTHSVYESEPEPESEHNNIRSVPRSELDFEHTDPRSMAQQSLPEYRSTTVPGSGYPPDSPYATPAFYSHEPPRLRPEYLPSPSPSASANPSYPPPPSQPINRMAMNRGRDTDPYDDDDYHSDSYRAPRRPRAVTRRSSSYHGPRDKDNYGYGQQLARRHHGTGSDTVDRYSDKARDAAHRYKLKEDINNMFTASKAGVAGGAVGAAIGGWAAQKAQVGYRKNGHKHDPNPILTLLGATVGGLAVNAAVDKWQDGKKETEKTEKRWEEKFGSEDESGDGRSHRSHRSHRRSRRDSYD